MLATGGLHQLLQLALSSLVELDLR